MDPYNPHPHVHGNVHPHVHHHVQAMNVLHALPIAAVAAPALLLAPDQQHNREHIDFLRREAVALEASAKRLRDLANVLENGGEIDTDGPYETAPLDENGVPKYKGKKRGRKPKKRLRKRNPHAKKRAHTAYTLVSNRRHKHMYHMCHLYSFIHSCVHAFIVPMLNVLT